MLYTKLVFTLCVWVCMYESTKASSGHKSLILNSRKWDPEESSLSITTHSLWATLPNDICGKSRRGSRIIGGKRASDGQFPWVVRIGYYDFNQNYIEAFCGGSIINERTILSAAHCFRDLEMLLEVVINVGNQLHTDRSVQGVVHRIKKVVRHPHYIPELFKNDIALIFLWKPIKYNIFVGPICLPNDQIIQKNLIGTQVTVAGWGVRDLITKSKSSDLHYTILPVISNEYCVEKFYNIDETQICVNVSSEGSDSCFGDSGGPLFQKDNGRVYQLGLVSFGERCAIWPAVYTNVRHYVKWILDTMSENL